MISLIVAFDENRVIGKGNRLPWNIPEDLEKFKKLTMGNVLIMGRKTFQGIGRPLPGRVNIVVTRDKKFNFDGIYTFDTIEKALKKALEFHREIFFMGGSSIYEQVVPFVEKLYISNIHGHYEGDSYFPEVSIGEFELIREEEYEKFTYREYVRKTSAV